MYMTNFVDVRIVFAATHLIPIVVPFEAILEASLGIYSLDG